MGYYLEVEHNLKKAEQLIELGATRLNGPPSNIDPTGQKVTVCVVQNGPFDAAGVAYNDDELYYFMTADAHGKAPMRPRTWLEVPRKLALELGPAYLERVLPQLKP